MFFSRHDPTQLNKQGNDVGTQYRCGIYYHNDEQKELSLIRIKKEQKKYDTPIVLELLPATTFYLGEDYHQQYLLKGGQSAKKNDTVKIRCYG